MSTDKTLKSSPDQKIPRILVVDDDPDVRVTLDMIARRHGAQVTFVPAADMDEGIALLNASCFDAAILDVCLLGVSGVSVGALIREHDKNIPLVYLSNLETATVKAQAIAQNALFLPKHRFFLTDDGPEDLIKIIYAAATCNPCIDGGIRIDDRGFPRQLPITPIQVPGAFEVMMKYSKQMARAA